MPAGYAHYRFGKLMLPTLPADVRQCIQRFRRMYDMGLQGPDFFFYYNPFVTTATGQLGNTFHRQSGQVFFAAAARAASSEAARAYLYGLLGHYCLDSACHPLINQLVTIGEAEHVALESEFDRFLLLRDKEPSPHTFDMSRHFKVTRGECMTIAAFYPGTTGPKVSRSIRLMGLFTRLLCHPNRKLREAILKKTWPSLCSFSIPAEENEALILYVRELHDLFRQASARYPVLLRQLQAHLETAEPLGEDFSPSFD